MSRGEYSKRFYRTDTIQTVLKRYNLSEKKKIIHAAILASEREKPNRLLAEKADAILQKHAFHQNTTTSQSQALRRKSKTKL